MSNTNRTCPVCGNALFFEFASEKINKKDITNLSYASRKEPEFMRLRLVRCKNCYLVYAPNPPNNNFLNTAYAESLYDSSEEANYAAATYNKYLSHFIDKIIDKNSAVDVGAGNGALIPYLIEHGFNKVIGIEPSEAAIESATDEIKKYLVQGFFSEHLLLGKKISLISSFMTLEHLQDPLVFAKSAYKLLEPGGMIALVVHNYKAFPNNILKLKSPIMDIQHLQLFCPSAIKKLLETSGFRDISIKSMKNTYSLKYWLRLLPLPKTFKKIINKFLPNKILALPCSIFAGNIFVVAIKN